MADILSFSKARKALARAEQQRQAVENRTRFGRTKAEKQRDAATKALEATKVDGYKRDE